MKRLLASVLIFAMAPPALADTLVAARTIRAQSILTTADVQVIEDDVPGAYSAVEDIVGLEARVALFAGRPIRSGELGPPAIIERNQLVTLLFQGGGLTITVDGRALGRAGVGDIIRVMNLASRQTVSGLVHEDGTITVGSSSPSYLSN